MGRISKKVKPGVLIVKRDRSSYWYREWRDGDKLKRVSLYTTDENLAWERALKEPELKIPGAPKPAFLTVGRAAELYQDWFKKNRRSAGIRRALPVVRQFVEFVGAETDTRTLTREHVQKFVEKREDGRAAITARNDFARVRALVNWIANRKDAADPKICKGIDFKPDTSTTREAPSLEKLQRVISKLRQSGQWIADYFEVLVETGLRPAELLGVRGVDLRGKLLSIVEWPGRELKSKWSKRVLTLNDNARRILEARSAKLFKKEQPIFHTPKGEVYQPNSAYHLFREQLADKDGRIPDDLDVTLYDARHAFASMNAAAGMEPARLGALMGHSPAAQHTLLRFYVDREALRLGAPPSFVAPVETTVQEMKSAK